MKTDSQKSSDSIAGQSAAHFVGLDESLAALLHNHGIEVRDFILLSFLSDQGPMSILRLSRTVGIEPRLALRSLRRLSSVNLVLRDPPPDGQRYESVVRLTSRGQKIALKIVDQLQ